MSFAGNHDAIQPPQSAPKSKKAKKKNKKNTKSNGETRINGIANDGHEQDQSDNENEDINEQPLSPTERHEIKLASDEPSDDTADRQTTSVSGLDTTERLEKAAKERNELRTAVTELRKSLEEMQKRHEAELFNMRSQLDETQTGKEKAEGQYHTLLGKVNTIRTQLGDRMKADAQDLAQTRKQLEEVEEQNKTIKEENNSLQEQISELNSEAERQAEELSQLRGRSSASQQSWARERDEMITRDARIREELETTRQAMQDWEVLATEEKSLKDGLQDRVVELEEQLSSLQESYNGANSERHNQSLTVDGLRRALQDVQEARKQELRELAENSETQLEELREQLKGAEESARNSGNALETTKLELERTAPFEKEVREKNLLIGKLRHEAVILNDHLTKALRFLKKGKPEDNVDRQLVTNHLLQFLALDRSDPKKFQVLQLIAAILGWTDDQKEAAGLSRPGAAASSTGSLRVPRSPFRRVSSSTSMNNPPNSLSNVFGSSTSLSPTVESPEGSANRETLAELWSGFLEREAQEGISSSHSRRTSVATIGSLANNGNAATGTQSGGGHGVSPSPTRSEAIHES